jgi:hypothetical protein
VASTESENFIEDLGYIMSLIGEKDMTRWQEYAGFGRKTWTEVITWGLGGRRILLKRI